MSVCVLFPLLQCDGGTVEGDGDGMGDSVGAAVVVVVVEVGMAESDGASDGMSLEMVDGTMNGCEVRAAQGRVLSTFMDGHLHRSHAGQVALRSLGLHPFLVLHRKDLRFRQPAVWHPMNWKVTGRKPTPLKAALTAGAGVGPGVVGVVVGTGIGAGVVAALPPALTAPLFKLGGRVKHAPDPKLGKQNCRPRSVCTTSFSAWSLSTVHRESRVNDLIDHVAKVGEELVLGDAALLHGIGGADTIARLGWSVNGRSGKSKKLGATRDRVAELRMFSRKPFSSPVPLPS